MLFLQCPPRSECRSSLSKLTRLVELALDRAEEAADTNSRMEEQMEILRCGEAIAVTLSKKNASSQLTISSFSVRSQNSRLHSRLRRVEKDLWMIKRNMSANGGGGGGGGTFSTTTTTTTVSPSTTVSSESDRGGGGRAPPEEGNGVQGERTKELEGRIENLAMR